ncbi:unnamed protein product [Ranitomeya imitator]|uniref:ribonuclease H n=1 Tax=Ranitomeya imitator TaxID=111125 RepID=A0ABN9LY12_9NEOB|nr:unnamed protein product [Ranitomeya imitator]
METAADPQHQNRRGSALLTEKNDVNFEEDADDIMDALGFGDHLESPHKEKSSVSRRSKFDELLGRGTSAKLLERPLTGEKKEFKLDPKYQKMAGDEDLAFGSYQPTMAFSPEGRPSRRSSVRFSAESNGAIKADARSRSATPVGRSPARDEKSGADWLGLKDEDVPDLTPLREPPRPSNVEPNTTGRPPSGTKSDSRLATQIKTSQIGTPAVQQDDDDEWLMSSLSRNKALKQEKLEEQKVQNRNDVKETSVGSSPVGSGNTIQQSDRGKTIQEIAPVLAEVSGPPLPWEIGVKTRSTTTPTSSITPTSSRQKENLVPAPSTTPSEMYRDKPATVQPKIQEGKKEIHGDVLHSKLLDLETQIRKLHLEREQQNLLLETLQQRHKEDLELIESAHRYLEIYLGVQRIPDFCWVRSDHDSDYESEASLDPDSPEFQATMDSLIEAVNHALKVDDDPNSAPDHAASFTRTKRSHRLFASQPDFLEIGDTGSDRISALQSGRLFGEKLDQLISDATGWKSKFLPQHRPKTAFHHQQHFRFRPFRSSPFWSSSTASSRSERSPRTDRLLALIQAKSVLARFLNFKNNCKLFLALKPRSSGDPVQQGASWFTKIDLRGAYNLVRIKQGDEWKTAFNTPEGHFEYLVMPFGLSNAPSVFQSFMHDIFREYLDRFMIVYLDDILVFSDDWESHVKQVRMVFQVLCANSLFVKVSKCLFGVQKVSFLGFIFSPSTIEMDPVKVQAIYDWTQPTSVKSLQKFLGFANFYRRFITNFSSVAKPLTDLTKKGADVVNWSSAAVEAFQELKRRFASAPVLCQPDVSLPFQVEVDASEIGAGAVLSQRSSDGSVMKPCAFFSRKFSPAERNYDVDNRELLAMKWAFEEWRHWLEGAKHRVVVLTDHKNLTYLESPKLLNAKQARWSLFVSRFDFVVSYLPGSKNVKADALSRSFVPDSPGVPEPAGILNPFTPKGGLHVNDRANFYNSDHCPFMRL